MAFYSRPFENIENIELCLNPACTALAILNLRELLPLFVTNKGIDIKNVRRHITKGKPRAARFAVSTTVGICGIN